MELAPTPTQPEEVEEIQMTHVKGSEVEPGATTLKETLQTSDGCRPFKKMLSFSRMTQITANSGGGKVNP